MNGERPSACPVCGSARSETIATAIGERHYCLACFHGWRPPMEAFPYEAVSMCPLGTSSERLRSQIDFFGRHLPSGGAVLEIGCATGELAAAARSALRIGRYEGIELSPAADMAQMRVDRLHREPLQTLLARADAPAGFDLVVMSHVLEHIADPVAEVRAIRRVLNDGGVFFVEVPNGAGCRGLPLDDNRSHLHFFSAGSLLRLLADQGLEAIDVVSGARLDARYSDSLRVAARKFAAPRWRDGCLSERLPAWADRGIVVWGAGSLTDELLANFFDLGRIDFFIDKDPRKQGGTRLGKPVRGPEALGTQARTVLVNSIDFADSIAADIAALYPDAAHRLVRIGDLLDIPPQGDTSRVEETRL